MLNLSEELRMCPKTAVSTFTTMTANEWREEWIISRPLRFWAHAHIAHLKHHFPLHSSLRKPSTFLLWACFLTLVQNSSRAVTLVPGLWHIKTTATKDKSKEKQMKGGNDLSGAPMPHAPALSPIHSSSSVLRFHYRTWLEILVLVKVNIAMLGKSIETRI